MSWFKSWFSSPFYEKVYTHRNQKEAQELLEWLFKIIPYDSSSSVLDLACGSGRHALLFAMRGYCVTGIDLSWQAIKYARAKAKEMGISNIRFIHQDMRRPIDGVYNLIVNLFTSFGYFDTEEEHHRVLINIWNCLKPQGWVIFDYLNPQYLKDNLVPFERIEDNELYIELHRQMKDDYVIKNIDIKEKKNKKTYFFYEKVKLLDIYWFKKHLEGVGLKIQNVYGNYQGHRYKIKESSRLIVVAVKP